MYGLLVDVREGTQMKCEYCGKEMEPWVIKLIMRDDKPDEVTGIYGREELEYCSEECFMHDWA